MKGQIHHFIGSLVPEPEERAKYIQLYFLDPQESVDLRLNVLETTSLEREILEIIEEELRNNNPYVTSLRAAREQINGAPHARIVIDPDRCAHKSMNVVSTKNRQTRLPLL